MVMFSCPDCDFMTCWKSSLKRHMMQQHEKKKQYTSGAVVDTENDVYACQYCSKPYTCRQNRWKHEQVCGSKKVVPVGSVVNQYINNNLTNNVTINVTLPPMPMAFRLEEDPAEPFDFQTDHMRANPRAYKGVKDVLDHLLSNLHTLPLRKKDEHSAYSEIHVGNNIWESKRDKEITPLFLFHSFHAIKDARILKFFRIIEERCDALIEALESCLQSPEYKDANDQKILKKYKSELNEYTRSLKHYMMENGKRYSSSDLTIIE